jgi:putative ABC transport system permease protein
MRFLELVRFALGGLWRQKVRTMLTLVGVIVGTCALAFSLALGFGLRAFIDREFQSKDDFWRITVRIEHRPIGEGEVPPDKIAVQGTMSDERRERLREALTQWYLQETIRKPPVMLSPEKVAQIDALPDVEEIRTYRTSSGRVWLGNRSTPAFTVAGRLSELESRLIGGRLPLSETAGEAIVSEFTLYRLGVRDDAALSGAIGSEMQIDIGGIAAAQPIALAQALTGRFPDERFSREEADALSRLGEQLPRSLEKFDLSKADRAALGRLLTRKPETEDRQLRDPSVVATGRFRIAGIVRWLTREEQKKVDPLSPWELHQGEVFLPPKSGEDFFQKLPEAREVGFYSADVVVRKGGDLGGTVRAIEGMGFSTFSALKWFQSARREVTLIAGGLNLFAIIALFIAGIGITNTLVTSVVERTREIGILKAVGATRGQVQGLFLMEGVAIGLAGSVVGLVLARGLAVPADAYIRHLIEGQMQGNAMVSETIFEFPWWLYAGSLLFAVTVTTAAAYYPARHAARIDPIQALKYE